MATEFAPVVTESIATAPTEQSAPVEVVKEPPTRASFDDVLRPPAAAAPSAPAVTPAAPPSAATPAVSAPPTAATRTRRSDGVPAKKKKRKSHWRGILVLLLVLGLVVAGGWWAIKNVFDVSLPGLSQQAPDYPGPGTGSVEITIDPDDLGTTIGNRLYDNGVVKSVEAFTNAFNANAASTSIKPGTYTLKKEMSAAQALAALLDEANRVDNALTINPGQNVADVREKLIKVAGFSEADVDAVIADPKDTGLPDVAGGKLEGWLWAGAYEAKPGDTPATVLARMVAPTVEFLTASGQPESDWETILTKASIVEKEVAIDEYMPKVARVIQNRLDDPTGPTQGMLQMDSTLLYGVHKSGGMPTTEDFANDNPYNTYMHAGLPPTPIATPSQAAIEAVLNPAEGDWLYFVTVNMDTGETVFTDSYDEMLGLVEKLTEWCKVNPGKC